MLARQEPAAVPDVVTAVYGNLCGPSVSSTPGEHGGWMDAGRWAGAGAGLPCQ
eukprot:XP_001695515.1 predicted protein [Chlamydomonas reinhardtii]